MSKQEYDKMSEYIVAVFNIFKIVHKKSIEKKDERLNMIALVIYNYVTFMTKTHIVTLNLLSEPESINMIAIFEYIAHNNIELYDFSKIEITDVDITKKEDLERFVLTHIYYITQQDSI